jgi:acyl-coenzyme A synthetase/AMP-(fatty) acid ligase/acyl carrier protein
MCNYVDHFQEYFELTRHDYVLQQSSISFDTSVEEIFPILASGGRLYILDDRKNINLLREIIVSEGITLLSATPLVLSYLNGLPVGDSLRIMISGGEVLHPDQINSFLDRGISVYNTYGPTETTVCVSYFKVEKPTGHVIPIGTPISNVYIYILDKFGRIQPQGVEGEIHIGGVSVAVNLAGDNLLVPSVLTDSIHSKDVLYRTGDLGELSNGTFYFTGRKDKQVKVRGNRIEPFEIEQVMLKYQNVKSATVVTVTQNGDTALVAFVVLSNPKHEQELNKFLVERLPDYMVPQKLILIDEIPLTDRGKPDVKLLESKLQAWTDDDSKIFFVPESSHETMLHKIWMDILKRDKISTTDNFFLLGGHSITANMLVVRIYEECLLRITLGDVFNYPTIRELANHLAAFEQDNFDVIELE